MIETYYRTKEQFLNQKPFSPYSEKLTENSIRQIDNIIKLFEKKYLINIKKEMMINLLKYNIDGDWCLKLKESEKYKKASCSLKACICRYGEIVGTKIYNENIEKIRSKKENYTEDKWKEICNKKRSNLGLNGYIQKFGKEEGNKKWNNYLVKWKVGIEKRKKQGWKSGVTLEELQEKYGIENGYQKWRNRINKRKKSLSLDGYIKKYGLIKGNIRWKDYCLSNNKTSLESFIKRHGENIGKIKYELMKEKICKYINNSPLYSKISQELFNLISKNLKYKENIKYALHNGEQYFLVNETFCRGMCVDFKYGNIIIEFFGNFWHANPSKYSEKDIIKYPNNHKIASEIWEIDNKKLKWLESRGYNVLIIWESDYLNNKQETIEKCIKFINENYERTQS